MDLAYEAIEAWDTWPELKDKGYYHRTGWVNLSPKGSDLSQRIRKNFRNRGHDPTQDISFAKLRSDFGGIFKDTDLDGYESAYWNPLAGWCDAGAATAEIMKEAVTHRGIHYVADGVSRLVAGSGKISGVETVSGVRYTADKILLATGAWTAALMSPIEDMLCIADADRVTSQMVAAAVCVAHYKMNEEEREELQSMPVVIYAGGDAQPLPTNNLLKFTNGQSLTNTITTTSGHRLSVPPAREQNVVPIRLQQETHEVITSKVLPKYTKCPAKYWRLCWDSVTPSQDHLITKHPHPKLSNLYLAVGGSFHSYKFLPNIGKYVVNVLNNISNGTDKDEHWKWKTAPHDGKGAHEKAYPTRELRDFVDGTPIARI